MKPAVLIIEDDPHIARGLDEVFTGEGFRVALCHRGDQACDSVRRAQPDLIILDIMLPGRSGYDICRDLRKSGCRIPLLMLTAKGQELDKVVGLDLGADDYVTKPFGVRELIARSRALLRRASLRNGAQEQGASFQIGESEINPRTFQLRRGARVESLTARELHLLQLMHAGAGEVFSRDRLLNEVWGYEYYGTTRTLDQTIVQLRKKLGDSAERPRHLLTVHGVGYKLVP